MNITDEFWTRYINEGKCAIDPEHTLYPDNNRYIGNQYVRTCCWCGQQQRAMTEIETRHHRLWRPSHSLCPVAAPAGE